MALTARRPVGSASLPEWSAASHGRARVWVKGKWWRAEPQRVSTIGAKLAALLARPKRRKAASRSRGGVDPLVQWQVQKLTAWQRHQWARAGYPSGRVGQFAEMRHGA
jgi:hypothetical protein